MRMRFIQLAADTEKASHRVNIKKTRNIVRQEVLAAAVSISISISIRPAIAQLSYQYDPPVSDTVLVGTSSRHSECAGYLLFDEDEADGARV